MMTPRGHSSLISAIWPIPNAGQAMPTKTAITNLLNLSEIVSLIHTLLGSCVSALANAFNRIYPRPFELEDSNIVFGDSRRWQAQMLLY